MARKPPSTAATSVAQYPAGRFVPPPGGVSVRMYRQGFGDCFLIAVSAGQGVFYMVIDCGVIKKPAKDPDFLSKVVRNIREETGGRIDALVVTHEHWDHLSGFSSAKDEWEQFEPGSIREVWAAWTETADDPLAKELGQQRRKAMAFVQRAMQHFSDPDGATQSRVRSLSAFFGAAEAGEGRTLKALNYALSRAKHGGKDNVRYLKPHGEPLKVAGVEGVRFYVLGPPYDRNLLLKSNPKKGEVYHVANIGMSLHSALRAAELRAAGEDIWKGMSREDTDAYVASVPFDRDLWRTWDDVKGDPFFAPLYGPRHGTKSHPQHWRRIDDDWIGGAAGRLALKLDDHINNTSLVLAIEIVATGKVLLFVGDAQVGNWESWHKGEWTVPGKTTPVKATDLLQNTVFYKVGHHGSHNATHKPLGLEKMTDPGLVAVIPTDRQMAADKRWNDIPFEPLLAALHERTRGRTIRADRDFPAGTTKKPHKNLSAAEWKTFKTRTTVTPLYVQHDVPGLK